MNAIVCVFVAKLWGGCSGLCNTELGVC